MTAVTAPNKAFCHALSPADEGRDVITGALAKHACGALLVSGEGRSAANRFVRCAFKLPRDKKEGYGDSVEYGKHGNYGIF